MAIPDLVDLRRQLDARRRGERHHAPEGGAVVLFGWVAQRGGAPDPPQLQGWRERELEDSPEVGPRHAIRHEARRCVEHGALRPDIERRSAGWGTPAGAELAGGRDRRSEEHTSELQSLAYLVC